MKLQHIRPEDRNRNPRADSPAWADTLPACFRSEGFAEDLHEPQHALASPPTGRPRGLRDAMRPLSVLTLAGVMGVLAR